LALWVAMALIPIAIAAVLVVVLTIRFKMWQARRRAGSVRSEGYVVRRP
jgi:cell division protein FtsX